ncbi:MAG: type IV toxin-antitoxin system AbiEi family antitoxin domain-containing protein [Elusimicrobiota bacterium]|jgi:predicted transcriptional regulator of viral defense system|nr:type IV toxin-antitoxin system AbiEi family antitoxin domain-containing protein [Elusimicrobiota bacterium]
MKQIKGYITTKELAKRGYSYKDIQTLCSSGKLIRLKQGLYRNAAMFGQNQGFIDISVVAPNAVITGLSALSFYNLTTSMPSKITIAVLRGSRLPAIDYPPVEIKTSSAQFFEIGINTVKEGKYSFKIYSIERAVCEAFRQINKTGADVAKESLGEYLKRKDKDINKLAEIAERCKVKNKIMPWVMAML